MTGPVLFISCLVVLAAVAIVWGRRMKAARTQALQAAAAELGLNFAPGPFKRETLPAALPDLEFFARGSFHRFSNLMRGTYASARVMVFDWSYRQGVHGGGVRRVIALEHGSRAIPEFSLQPEFHLGPFINTRTVSGKVDFPALPEFAKCVAVSRIDAARAQAFFTERRAAFFLARWGTAAESRDGWLYVCREDQPVYANEKPDAAALRAQLEQVREVREALGGAAGRPG